MNLFCKQKTLVALCTLLLLQTAFALPSDSEQPMSFQADRFEMDEVKNTQTYSGSVVMEQGSLKITADKVVIHRRGNRVSLVVATGRPAHYTQIAQVGQEPVVAQAHTMEYNVESKTLHLIESASIFRSGTSLSGNKIDYDVKRALVKAESSQHKGADGRVRMVIPPQNRKGE